MRYGRFGSSPGFVFAALLTLGPAPVDRARAEAPDAALRAEAREAAGRAVAGMRAIATHGGWVWRYSPDLRFREGEAAATPTMIWVQPPGTPSVGMAMLRGFEATGDRSCLDAAQEAADALALGQLASGGWDYSIDFAPEAAARRDKAPTTLDDDVTQSAVRFLLAVIDAAPDADTARDRRIRAACDRALAALLAAQYPNGAWPQRFAGRAPDPADFPVRPAVVPADWPREWRKRDYRRDYTLNDNVLRDCVGVMLDAHRRRGDPRYLDAARRAGDFLILAQLPAPQAAWAQQYDAAMHPAWARAFEPPAVTAAESVGAVRTLVELFHETGDRRYLAPVPAALDWWRRSAIGPGRWARYYELGTNRPVYGDRDGRIHYRLDEISAERRTGYDWEGEFGVQAMMCDYERAATDGPRRWRPKKRAAPAADRVRAVIAALDDAGLWVTRRAAKGGDEGGDRIETAVFVHNLDILTECIKAAEPGP